METNQKYLEIKEYDYYYLLGVTKKEGEKIIKYDILSKKNQEVLVENVVEMSKDGLDDYVYCKTEDEQLIVIRCGQVALSLGEKIESVTYNQLLRSFSVTNQDNSHKVIPIYEPTELSSFTWNDCGIHELDHNNRKYIVEFLINREDNHPYLRLYYLYDTPINYQEHPEKKVLNVFDFYDVEVKEVKLFEGYVTLDTMRYIKNSSFHKDRVMLSSWNPEAKESKSGVIKTEDGSIIIPFEYEEMSEITEEIDGKKIVLGYHCRNQEEETYFDKDGNLNLELKGKVKAKKLI